MPIFLAQVKAMKQHLFFLLLFWSCIAFSQTTSIPTADLYVYYSFDDCTAMAENSIIKADFGDKVLANVGKAQCDPETCLFQGDGAIYFDGLDDQLVFLNNMSDLFRLGDFSYSFYFKPKTGTEEVAIFSSFPDCEASGMAIYYDPTRLELSAILQEEGASQSRLTVSLEESTCWQHIVLTRKGGRVQLYVNGQLEEEISNSAPIDLGNVVAMIVGSSICKAKYKGALDELRIYQRALTAAEVQSLYAPANKILNRDTVLLRYQKIDLQLYGECASTTYYWGPWVGLDNGDLAQPTLTALESNFYVLTAEEAGCRIRDTFQLRVIDPIPFFELKANPVQEELVLYFDREPTAGASLSIVDVLGRLLYQANLSEDYQVWTIATDQLAVGNYMIRMVLGNESQTEVFLKN